MSFPLSPNPGDYYTTNLGILYRYDGTRTAWMIQDNSIVGSSGYSGYSGYSGATGAEGSSGASGTNGSSGYSGKSGYSGTSVGVVSNNYYPISNGSSYQNGTIYVDGDGLELPGIQQKLGANPTALIENYLKNDTAGHYLRNTLYGTTYVGTDIWGQTAANTANWVGGALTILTIGTYNGAPVNIGTNATIRLHVNGDGTIDIVDLNAGGLVKAASSTGKLSIATADTDYTTNGVYTDWSASDNPTGFSSVLNNIITYKVVGKICHLWFFIQGTSNATSFGFTLPVNEILTSQMWFPISVVDNGGAPQVTPGTVSISGTTASLSTDWNGGLWAASLTKGAAGYIAYPVA